MPKRRSTGDSSARRASIPPAHEPRAEKPLSWKNAKRLLDARKAPATQQLLPWQQRKLVSVALVLLEQSYVHLSAKRALYAIEPVRRLKLLQRTLELRKHELRAEAAARPRSGGAAVSPNERNTISDEELHRELLEIFLLLRDPHTRYYLPRWYRGQVGFLPFMVEDVFEKGVRRYIVSKVAHGLNHGTFAPGVEIRYWNGMQIERAVLNHAQRSTGSNAAARHAEAVMTLTLRVLEETPEPDEDWVVVDYVTKAGRALHEKFYWKVGTVGGPGERAAILAADADSINGGLSTMKLAQRDLFAGTDAQTGGPFLMREVDTKHGTFSYVRIWNFDVEEEKFVGMFLEVLAAARPEGLIIDIRGNPGGRMSAAEYILQTLTPREIEPEPLQFLNSPVNLRICSAPQPPGLPDLHEWVDAIDEGLQTGAVYSAAFPKSDPRKCNEHGQRYFGPVVLITDALSYSAADMFAAGFQDHGIGVILGTDERTGGGGANTWDYNEKFRAYRLPEHPSIEQGITFRAAIRRALRVGPHAGAVLEDFGVKVDHCQPLTATDVMHQNRELIERAASLVADALTIDARSSDGVGISVFKAGMSKLEIYVDGVFRRTVAARAGRVRHGLKLDPPARHSITLKAFDARDTLIARYWRIISAA